MITRALFLGILLAIVGVLCQISPQHKFARISESQLASFYPTEVGRFSVVPGSDGSNLSYRMDKPTYDELSPIGIVSRTFASKSRKFDVVIIAGDHGGSFHDPIGCFSAQDWTILSSDATNLSVPNRGLVPITIVHARKNGEVYTALYTYEGPTAMYASNTGLKADMFLSQLRKGRVQLGTFYRFLTIEPNAPDEELKGFAASYLSACPVRPIPN